MSENLTIEDLCLRWKVGRGTLAYWRHKKKGPNYIKVGRQILYPAAAVTEFEEKNLTETRQ